MEYIFKNDLLTEDEKKVIKRNADDKIVDLLLLLSKKADGVFFGKMRFFHYVNKISFVEDQIKTIDDLINNLGTKTDSDLQEIAKSNYVSFEGSFSRSDLLQQVKVVLNNRKKDLLKEKTDLYNASDRNYNNTFEHTINSIIEQLNTEYDDEYGISRKNYLKSLINDFDVISSKLKTIHQWFDDISNSATLINDYKEELANVNELLKMNQEKFALIPDSNDPKSKASEMRKVLEDISLYRHKKKDLIESIAKEREKILNAYKPDMDFVELKNVIYDKLRAVKANIEDALIDTRETDIDKYIIAFNEFFYDLVSKQFELENYLDDNNIEFDLNKFKNLFIDPDELTNDKDDLNKNFDLNPAKPLVNDDNPFTFKPAEDLENQNNPISNEPVDEPEKSDDISDDKTKDDEPVQQPMDNSNDESNDGPVLPGIPPEPIKNNDNSHGPDGGANNPDDNTFIDNFVVVDASNPANQDHGDDNLSNDSGNGSGDDSGNNPDPDDKDPDYTFKEVMYALCVNTKDRVVFKVREVKETTAEKLAQQRAKVKKAIIDAKDLCIYKN